MSKPLIVEFNDGKFLIFDSIEEYRSSEYYNRNDWVMMTPAEFYSPAARESILRARDEDIGEDPLKYLKEL